MNCAACDKPCGGPDRPALRHPICDHAVCRGCAVTTYSSKGRPCPLCRMVNPQHVDEMQLWLPSGGGADDDSGVGSELVCELCNEGPTPVAPLQACATCAGGPLLHVGECWTRFHAVLPASARRVPHVAASNTCRVHPALALDMFCGACTALVCMRCAVLPPHRGHPDSVLPVDDALVTDERVALAQGLIDSISSALAAAAGRVEAIDGQIADLLDQRGDAMRELAECMALSAKHPPTAPRDPLALARVLSDITAHAVREEPNRAAGAAAVFPTAPVTHPASSAPTAAAEKPLPSGPHSPLPKGPLTEFMYSQTEEGTVIRSAGNTVTLKGHSSAVWSVSFSSDGSKVATGSGDKLAKIWDVASGRELVTLKGHSSYVRSVSFSSDGSKVATGSRDNLAKIWDVASGRELVTLKGHSSYVNSVSFSSDGSKVATGSWDNLAKIWDVASGRELVTLKGHSNTVWSVSFSSDGSKVATGSEDKLAKIWDVASGREMNSVPWDGVTLPSFD